MIRGRLGSFEVMAERPDRVARILKVAPLFAVIAVLYSLGRLAVHLVFGGDTSVGHAILGAAVFFAIAMVFVPVCDGVARWWRESGDRQAS